MAKGSAITQVPLIISAVKAWFNAANISSITSSGNAVSSVRDTAGRVTPLVQATGASQPTTNTRTINGINAFGFNGSSSNMACPLFIPNLISGSFTCFVVAKSDVSLPAAGANILTPDSGGNRVVLQLLSTGVINSIFGPGTPIFLASGVPVGTNPFIAMISHNGTTDLCTIKVNNETAVTGTKAFTGAPTSLRLASNITGTDNFWTGPIGELISFDKILSASEEISMWRYLSNKWGIAIS